MKKTVYTLSLCLGILCFSCESNQNSSNDVLKKSSENKTVNAASRKMEVTKRPDTIIDGKQIYNFGKENVKKKEISLEGAIKEFESGVNNAKDCDELIRSCATFDARIKQLNKANNKINITEVEKRADVRAIRKKSEEKSLKLCQAQQVR
jgi:exonuclease VII small subunit